MYREKLATLNQAKQTVARDKEREVGAIKEKLEQVRAVPAARGAGVLLFITSMYYMPSTCISITIRAVEQCIAAVTGHLL